MNKEKEKEPARQDTEHAQENIYKESIPQAAENVKGAYKPILFNTEMVWAIFSTFRIEVCEI